MIEATQALLNQLGPGLDVEDVLGDLPGDAQHFFRSPRKNILVMPEEVDELTFLYRAQASPDQDGLGQVLNVYLDGLGVLDSLEGVRCGASRHNSFSSMVESTVVTNPMLFCSQSNNH
jgi:hypothetical protein